MIVTRDEILFAIEYTFHAWHPSIRTAFGRSYEIWDFIDAIHGNGNWRWEDDEQGRNEMLMFLAFLLTWWDELEQT